MPLNDDYLCFVTNGGTFLVESYTSGTINKYINLTGTSYAATGSAGVSDFGSGPNVFLINTSGHLEVVYGSSGNLTNANAVDLGTPP